MSHYKSGKYSFFWFLWLGLYLAYSCAGIFYPINAFIGQLFLLGMILLGLYGAYKVFFSNRKPPKPLIWIFLFWVLISVSYIVSPQEVFLRENHTMVTTKPQYKDYTCFLLATFTGYWVGVKCYLSNKKLLISSLITLLCAFLRYDYNIKEALLKGMDEFTNNAAYGFISVLPFIIPILKKYPVTSGIVFFAIFSGVMVGAKRGAIITLGVVIALGLLWYLRQKKLSWRKTIIILVGGCLLYYGVDYYISSNDYLNRRLESTIEGNSSNRERIYSDLWEAFLDADLVTMLFGRGLGQTMSVTINFAHNDWLEILTDNGILGIILFLGVIVSLFRDIQ